MCPASFRLKKSPSRDHRYLRPAFVAQRFTLSSPISDVMRPSNGVACVSRHSSIVPLEESPPPTPQLRYLQIFSTVRVLPSHKSYGEKQFRVHEADEVEPRTRGCRRQGSDASL